MDGTVDLNNNLNKNSQNPLPSPIKSTPPIGRYKLSIFYIKPLKKVRKLVQAHSEK